MQSHNSGQEAEVSLAEINLFTSLATLFYTCMRLGSLVGGGYVGP